MLGRFVLLLGCAAASIYPEGHFDLSTKLTVSNYKDVIQAALDADQTLFAPAWNEAVRAFNGNAKVAFADVMLAEEQIREGADGTSFAPGAGGWPTIRYFNKGTGVGGAPYMQKTHKSMCDELGPTENYMTQYVLDAGGTSLCDAATGLGCSTEEMSYYKKYVVLGPAATIEEQRRLTKMAGKTMKADAAKWLRQRRGVLEQVAAATAAEEL